MKLHYENNKITYLKNSKFHYNLNKDSINSNKRLNVSKIIKHCQQCNSKLSLKTGNSTSKKYCNSTCRNKYEYNNNPKIKEWKKCNFIKNKDKIYERNRNWNKNNRDKVNNYVKQKKKYDILYKLRCSYRARTAIFLSQRNYKKTSSITKMLGCSPDELKLHIEKQFTKGMSWDNWNLEGWHIDHIIPLASATTEKEVYKLCHYSNLQPLWALDNLKKGIN